MSAEAFKWAMDIGEQMKLEPAKRQILWLLGNIADPSGGSLFPSHAYIARRTGLAKSTVRAHLAELETIGLVKRAERSRDDNSRTSNAYQLLMTQPGLPLDDTPHPPMPTAGTGVPTAGRARADQRVGGVPAAGTLEVLEEYKEEGTAIAGGPTPPRPAGKGRAGKDPTPVARGFQRYAQGIKRLYGADYPPSAKANGQIANVVGRVGAANIEAVVDWYLGQGGWYATVKHKLDYLVRDCEQLYMALQAAARGPGEVLPTKACVAFLSADERVMKNLGEVPAGDPQKLARQAVLEHGRYVTMNAPKYVGVRMGKDRRIFSIEELTRRATA